MDLTGNDVLTDREVAHLLRVDTVTVQRALRKGELPGIKIGKQWRISKTTLATYLAGRKVKRAKNIGPKKAVPSKKRAKRSSPKKQPKRLSRGSKSTRKVKRRA